MVTWLTRVGLTALVLVSIGHTLPVNAADAATVLKSLEATRPDWLPGLDTCPADVMPARETQSRYYEGRCENTLDECVSNCRAGKPEDCYALAVALQRVKGGSAIPEALFLRACALGVMSGCTNRAAAMDSGPGTPCAIRTFTAACDHDDPWACTMIGMHLARGIGIGKDHKRARQVLSKSCRFGEADEACSGAKALMKEMRE